jgi:hypothetical protein
MSKFWLISLERNSVEKRNCPCIAGFDFQHSTLTEFF